MPATTRANWSSDIAVGWWLWMSITGNFAFGTGCSPVFSVLRGLYWVIVGSGNSGVRPSPGRRRNPDGPALAGRRRRLPGGEEPGAGETGDGQPDDRCAHAWGSPDDDAESEREESRSGPVSRILSAVASALRPRATAR